MIFGIIGLFCGLFAAIGAFIWQTMSFAWGFGLVGIVVSAIGMSSAKKSGGSSGLSIAGLVVSIVGFVIALPAFICWINLHRAAAALRGFGF